MLLDRKEELMGLSEEEMLQEATREGVIECLKKAAEQGQKEAQNNLALMYVKGEGIPEDKQEAFKWFKKAAEQGLAVAQYNLALMYEKGDGVESNEREAFRWYMKAAEHGSISNEDFIGNAYMRVGL